MAVPVADQVAEVVVIGMDDSRCRLVPEDLLLRLREVLRLDEAVGKKEQP